MESAKSDTDLIDRLLSVIDEDILPMTAAGVAAGNKLFGAALIHKQDYSTVLAETNNELENPLWHGEVHLLKRYYELPEASRPATGVVLTIFTSCSAMRIRGTSSRFRMI